MQGSLPLRNDKPRHSVSRNRKLGCSAEGSHLLARGVTCLRLSIIVCVLALFSTDTAWAGEVYYRSQTSNLGVWYQSGGPRNIWGGLASTACASCTSYIRTISDSGSVRSAHGGAAVSMSHGKVWGYSSCKVETPLGGNPHLSCAYYN